MSNLSQSDLILAGRFVDGDLPAHEAEQAEKRITTDAAFAAAVEQVRVQSSLLGKLPKFKPSDDLADRTLQASMDQVKAIMGAWPIESESDDHKVSVASDTPSSSFDWKSTVALVASLAGVFMLGLILWQNSFPGESNMAMSEASMEPGASIVQSKMFAKSSPEFDAEELADAAEQTIVESELENLPKVASKSSRSFEKAFTGTPMKQKIPESIDKKELVSINSAAQVAQIWCVSQDRTASKSFVCDVLNSNEIAVQPKETQDKMQTADSVEAFYVAATPNQMKLAMAQISNNADIEMIKLPSGADSPIADAIQQQFTQGFTAPQVDAAASPNNNLPTNFQRSQALGQRLVASTLPRGVPSPVPPILKSGSEIEGLNSAPETANLAMSSRSKSAPAALKPGGGAGMGGVQMKKKDEVDADVVMVDAIQQQQGQQATAGLSAQQAEFDKYLDDSEQLQQYLILVRGVDGENK